MPKKEKRPPIDPEKSWNHVHNSLINFQIGELREAIKLIEGRIAQLEATKRKTADE